MTVHELAMQLRAARGSVEEDEAEILRLATAVLRACIELEAARENPRFTLFAEAAPALVAGDEEAATYAWLLGEEADRLAASDPLPSPARAEEDLALVPRPESTAPLPLQRLLRLAATASKRAALSSRNELYPRGMAAEQALRLSLGSLAGARVLTPGEIRERVHGRYPDAEPLPARPDLDRLLADAGADRDWREDGDAGPGYYARHLGFASTGTSSPHRYDTTAPAVDATPEVLDARALEEKLRHAARTGSFLALTVEPRRMAQAEAEVLRRFPRERLSLDRLLLEAMRAQAEILKVRWPVVLAADAEARDSRDFQNLLRLVGRAAPVVQQRILTLRGPALLVHPGLLARYELMKMLDDLRDASGTKNGPPGLWLLIPQVAAGLPTIDGQPVPVLSTAHWARLTDAWLTNAHRAGSKPAA
jgi:hypothetical protein